LYLNAGWRIISYFNSWRTSIQKTSCTNKDSWQYNVLLAYMQSADVCSFRSTGLVPLG
jgi:hypothetical protein